MPRRRALTYERSTRNRKYQCIHGVLNIENNNEPPPQAALSPNHRDHIPDADRIARREAKEAQAVARAAEARQAEAIMEAERQKRIELREREIAERAREEGQQIAADLVAAELKRVDDQLNAIREEIVTDNERLREQLLRKNEDILQEIAVENEQFLSQLATERERLEREHADRLLAVSERERAVDVALSDAINRHHKDVGNMIEGWLLDVPIPIFVVPEMKTEDVSQSIGKQSTFQDNFIESSGSGLMSSNISRILCNNNVPQEKSATYSDISSAELNVTDLPVEKVQKSNPSTAEILLVQAPGPSHQRCADSSIQEQQQQLMDICVPETPERSDQLMHESNGASPTPTPQPPHEIQQDHSQIAVIEQIDDEQEKASTASSEPLLSESIMNHFGDWVNDI